MSAEAIIKEAARKRNEIGARRRQAAAPRVMSVPPFTCGSRCRDPQFRQTIGVAGGASELSLSDDASTL